MKLSKDQIKQIARLSKLSLSEEQIANLETDLAKMMDLVDQVQNADTTGITELGHVHDVDLKMREDVAVQPKNNLAKDASNNKDGFVVVPKVIS